MKKLSLLLSAVLAVSVLSGCSTLRKIWKSDATQSAIAADVQRLAGTDKLAQKFDAAEERSQLAYAFTWLTAEKAGITETQARDWLANRGAAPAGEGEAPEDAAAADAIDFASLEWKFGGENGSKAALSTPRLSNLKASATSISYKWEKGLDDWGLAKEDAGALACLFVTRLDGSVVGGKFDWVSTSRSSRGLENVLDGYEGWTLADVPATTKIYFVVLSKDCRKRSNVVSCDWTR